MNNLSNRNFTKKYADNSQKTGGKVWLAVQAYIAGRKDVLKRPGPAPSVHAWMRANGKRGPAKGTNAYKKMIAKAVRTVKGKRGNR